MANGLPTRLGLGVYWQDLAVGDTFATFRRTIREADLAAFVALTGMFEETFIDATHVGPLAAGTVPGALTYSFIEGLIVQTLLRGVGLALFEAGVLIKAPVRVGDTVSATVTITGVHPTSANGRAVVDSLAEVQNQGGELVMTYSARRLIAGRPQAAAVCMQS